MGNRLVTLRNSLVFPAPPPSYRLGQFPTLKVIDGVPCLVHRVQRHRGYILYLHSNGVDLGALRPTLYTMARDTRHSVYAPEYPGYGAFAGTATPEAVVACARRVYNHVQTILKPGEHIIIVGRSVGSGVAIHVAATAALEPAALVMISPFESLRAMAVGMFGPSVESVARGVFENKRLIAQTSVPTLILAGRLDTFTPISHSQSLFAASGARRKQLYILPNSTHARLDWTAIYSTINDFTNRAMASAHHARSKAKQK
jgi:pimeloyl-ACP methyl ester carboxylesterase